MSQSRAIDKSSYSEIKYLKRICLVGRPGVALLGQCSGVQWRGVEYPDAADDEQDKGEVDGAGDGDGHQHLTCGETLL